MAIPGGPALSPVVRFPNFTDLEDLNSLSIVIQDLSVIYDVSAVAVSPDYGYVLMPTTRIGPRRHSPLRAADRLRVKSVSPSSPLVMVFYLAISVRGTLAIAKAFLDVLAKGTDIIGRIQVLGEDRALARERTRGARLRNDILEERLRRVRAEPQCQKPPISHHGQIAHTRSTGDG